MWYRTMTAILLRRERGRNNTEMYAVLVVTPPPPPPPLQREVTFQKGGRNDARVRYNNYGATHGVTIIKMKVTKLSNYQYTCVTHHRFLL